MIGQLFGTLIAIAAFYFAGAFVSAKLFKRDQWPFKAAALELKGHDGIGGGSHNSDPPASA